jgi:hypothetical protein
MTSLRRAAVCLVAVVFACLAASSTSVASLGVTPQPVVETAAQQQVPIVRQVKASAKRLLRALSNDNVREARRLASPRVLEHLEGSQWRTVNCYRTSGDPDDDFEYTGPLRWGCNFYNDFGGVGVGYKKVDGVWKALAATNIAD